MSRLIVRNRGLRQYEETYSEMTAFNDERTEETTDELWILEHSPVYTLGMAGKAEHILDAGEIPVIKTDRGGQVTYHGPGQLVMYPLVDLKRKAIGIKKYVSLLEQIIIDMLAQTGITGDRRKGAPGVYVNEKKIAALGVRVRKGRCYHGLALNVNMDLGPFQTINPCGYPNLEVTQLKEFDIEMTVHQAGEKLLPILKKHLGYESCDIISKPECATSHQVA